MDDAKLFKVALFLGLIGTFILIFFADNVDPLEVDVCDINGAIEFSMSIDGLDGIVIIKGADIGVWGTVRLSDQ